MTKLSLTSIATLTNDNTATANINANNAAISTAFDNTLSRDGTSPNQMGASLDMNSNRVLNLPAPVNGSEPLRLSDLLTLRSGGTIATMPVGGTTGQVLSKLSNADFALAWTDSVTSVGLALPADFTISNSPVTTTGNLTAVWATTPTGTGAVVRATSPALVTPTLGVATATTLNKLTLTQPATGSTLTILDNKTLTVNNTLTLAGTDGTVQTFPATSGTVVSSVTSAGGDLTGTYPSPTINGNAVTNAKLATAAAYTFKGNATGSTAAITDIDVTALTLKASPTASDLVMIHDAAASNAFKKATIGSISSAGSVTSVNGQTGTIISYFEPQGRLTLQTGVPVMTTTQSAKTTIYYTPYHGNMVPIYDGTNMVPTAVTEISAATTDTTKSPAAIGASKVNDWFVWSDAGTIRVGHGPDWTNDTTRSAGTALVMVNGILLNSVSITNGPAASRGTYVGTTRSNGSNSLDWIYGASSAGGTPGVFYVWNAYNRRLVETWVGDSTASWAIPANTTARALNNSTGNRVSYVSGAAEDAFSASCTQLVTPGSQAYIGVGYDTIVAFTGHKGVNAQAVPIDVLGYDTTNSLGAHFFSAIEGTNTSAATSFTGTPNLKFSGWM